MLRYYSRYSVFLVCAVLKTLHVEKDSLTAEECRRVGKAGNCWFEELARTIAMKPPDVVELVVTVLEEYKEENWYSWTANPIKGEHTYLLYWRFCTSH